MIRAIIADDEPAVASIIKHLIKREGLPLDIVGVAENGGQALELIRKIKPDLTFIDIQMPIYTGLEVMRQCPDTRYIIITAFESFSYAQEALRLGACDILLKPIDSAQFIEAVSRSIEFQFTANQLTNEILHYIHRNYSEQIDLRLLGEMLHASPSHLARTFKKFMNISIVSYINKVRIDKAKALLADQGLSIQEIASSVGYESLNNFYKYFKMITGFTPAVYRQSQIAGKSIGQGD
ncbi:helix-turn-helix domain-containing protein [Deltaproteobacteria bacterium OttesenSCG-928-K17]|nr:helix-turn-helix domain-containing protein [Deltaproteobacteria bacterium OttesenSCG-928-K17]